MQETLQSTLFAVFVALSRVICLSAASTRWHHQATNIVRQDAGDCTPTTRTNGKICPMEGWAGGREVGVAVRALQEDVSRWALFVSAVRHLVETPGCTCYFFIPNSTTEVAYISLGKSWEVLGFLGVWESLEREREGGQ